MASSIKITNQMFIDKQGNHLTRCWAWDEKARKYIMTEEKSMDKIRLDNENHCYVKGNPDDNRDARNRPILGKIPY